MGGAENSRGILCLAETSNWNYCLGVGGGGGWGSGDTNVKTNVPPSRDGWKTASQPKRKHPLSDKCVPVSHYWSILSCSPLSRLVAGI
jgi:hypothetical protein